jgi:hypothetical protein
MGWVWRGVAEYSVASFGMLSDRQRVLGMELILTEAAGSPSAYLLRGTRLVSLLEPLLKTLA